jgi:hypothetical protein
MTIFASLRYFAHYFRRQRCWLPPLPLMAATRHIQPLPPASAIEALKICRRRYAIARADALAYADADTRYYATARH